MPNKPTQPPGGYSRDNRPTSPPPPRRKEPHDLTEHIFELVKYLRGTIEALQTRNNEQFQKIQLLNGQLANALERIGRHECPDCGESDQIVECHHDGETCGVPECDFKHCNGCGHQWGHN